LVAVGRFRQYVNYVTGSAAAPPTPGIGIHTRLNGGLGLVDNSQVSSDGSAVYETGWEASWNADIASAPANASLWNTDLACNDASTWTNAAGSQESLPLNCVDWCRQRQDPALGSVTASWRSARR
jgi:hypothetical protein